MWYGQAKMVVASAFQKVRPARKWSSRNALVVSAGKAQTKQSSETLQQYVGRLHRLHDNKRVVQVYDYVDDQVPMLARMYERRLKGYSAIGYTIDRQDPTVNDLSERSIGA
jgi:hypothetical protein